MAATDPLVERIDSKIRGIPLESDLPPPARGAGISGPTPWCIRSSPAEPALVEAGGAPRGRPGGSELLAGRDLRRGPGGHPGHLLEPRLEPLAGGAERGVYQPAADADRARCALRAARRALSAIPWIRIWWSSVQLSCTFGLKWWKVVLIWSRGIR